MSKENKLWATIALLCGCIVINQLQIADLKARRDHWMSEAGKRVEAYRELAKEYAETVHKLTRP